MLRGGWAAGDAYQWMFDEQTALFPSTYLHYTADDSPPPVKPCPLPEIFLAAFRWNVTLTALRS